MGPYLSERQWGTVREDYSPEGEFWHDFPHDHARSRAYRWGEDGLLGWTDRQCRLCFALALWNGQDPILKERLFGLTNPEGNHGEDVKEVYRYHDATPTYSWAQAMYRYPHAAFPYEKLIRENAHRSRQESEYELSDTGIFDENRFCDISVEYAKAGPQDILIRVLVENYGTDPASLCVIPTLWFRNTWTWGCTHEGCALKPHLLAKHDHLYASHESLGSFQLQYRPAPDGTPPELLFTENHTNRQKLYGQPNNSRYVKDAFHDYLIAGQHEAVNPENTGTKAGLLYRLETPPNATIELRFRLTAEGVGYEQPLDQRFDEIINLRQTEADAYYDSIIGGKTDPSRRVIARTGYAGLLWSKQFYHYVVEDWLGGDPNEIAPSPQRWQGRNQDWTHLFNRDVISMPDKWEFPWYATWDLGFHMIPMAQVDPDEAKRQCMLFL